MSRDDGGTLEDVGEFGLIARVTGEVDDPRVIVGPGDDAAVVTTPDGRAVITCDMLVEGRHFRRDWSTPVDIGRKAAAASLADVAAMGAQPTSLVVAFGAPGDLPTAWAVACCAAITAEAALAGAVVVGGDVVAAPEVVISITAIGDLAGRSPVLRAGARAGDIVAIAGRFGWSGAGLALLSRGFRSPKVLVDAHRYPQPPYASGVDAALAGATAMVDVSDGLVADARHLAEASGVVVEIETVDWDIPEPMQAAAAAYNVDARSWMLSGGEDHALLATFPAGKKLPAGFTVIGQVAAGEAAVLVDGEPYEGAGGHRHFG